MPRSHPNRRDSWPPTILRLFDDELNTLPNSDHDVDVDVDIDADIDSNPFEYFLTSPEDTIDEDELFEDLSAGIEEANDVPSTPVREVSPSSLQRLAMPAPKDSSHLDMPGQGYAVPMSLHDFTLSHAASKKNAKRQPGNPPAGNPDAITATGNDTVPLSSSLAIAPRGRGNAKLSPRGRGKTGRRESPRPHSWREPSPDVWSIPEEGDAPGLSADEEALVVEKEPVKKKKKVHWAI